MTDDLADQLRAWATGSYGLEAATEVLLRYAGGRFARPGWPGIQDSDPRPWIDFAAIPDASGTLSGNQRRILLSASSLAEAHPVVLGDAVAGLDRRSVSLVLAALSQTSGSHHHSDTVSDRDPDGNEIITPWGPRLELGPLYPWPNDTERGRA